MQDKIKRTVQSIGMECLVKNIERVYNGASVEGDWTPKSIRTRTSHIRRIIREGWCEESLSLVKNSKLYSELGSQFEKTLKQLNLI